MQRPKIHATKAPWTNSVVSYYGLGQYHLFVQYDDVISERSGLSWGHFSSENMWRWEEHPDAFKHDSDYDLAGCWMGSIVEHKGTFYAFYSGIESLFPVKSHVCLATSKDLITWEKSPQNPLDIVVPPKYGPKCRDPFVRFEDGRWSMYLGSQIQDFGGVILRFVSDDLMHWEFQAEFFCYPHEETAPGCENPNLFELNGTTFLTTSGMEDLVHEGNVSQGTFRHRSTSLMDGFLGTESSPRAPFFHGAGPLQDTKGRTILFGWINEFSIGESALVNANPWGGIVSCPRVVEADESGLIASLPDEITDIFTQELGDRSFRVPSPDPLLYAGPAYGLLIDGNMLFPYEDHQEVHVLIDGDILELVGGSQHTLRFGPNPTVIEIADEHGKLFARPN